jgi:hypothetical protein
MMSFLSVEMDLKKRLEYLSRAVVCVKSVETNSASAGDALGTLQDILFLTKRLTIFFYSRRYSQSGGENGSCKGPT